MSAANSANSPLLPIGSDIPYERFLDCVHCGLCTSSCPTYVETGNENDSPRGRIHLMRSVVDQKIELSDRVRKHIDLCLDCRSCETACPSGVQYGRLIEPFRVDMEQGRGGGGGDATSKARPDLFTRTILHGLFPFRKRLSRVLWPARIFQALGIQRAVDFLRVPAVLPQRLRRLYRQLPTLPPSGPSLCESNPPTGPRRAKVGLFVGCVADAMFRPVHHATVRVLQENGCEVVVPSSQGCCGAIHYHSGAAEPAMGLMQQNLQAFPDDLDAIVVNVAGCGAMLKDYGHVASENGAAKESAFGEFADRVQDVHEFLVALGVKKPPNAVDVRVVYQDACHLQHAQRIREAPRTLLKMIPELKLLEAAEAELCCGAAGTYNLTQPEMADRLGTRKIDNLLATNPDLIASANVGCSLQLQATLKQAGCDVAVRHPIELLDLSYRGESIR